MCGIAGFVGIETRAAERAVSAMNAAQRHRGPDWEGMQTIPIPGGCLTLGHRRLSILDLSPAAHQPMTDPETGDWIVFNGEIYNYRELRAELAAAGADFRTQSDTEVLLKGHARWGSDLVRRIHGMYAFAYYDHRNRRLVLARDPLGIKPLYYHSSPLGFVFASEVRAIRAARSEPLEIDRRALAGLLAYGAVQGPLTILREVRLLEPGSLLELDLSRAPADAPAPRRFWEFPLVDGSLRREQAVERIGAALGAAAARHLLSDVPVGIFLSSGLDSSAIATLCARSSGAPPKALTVRASGVRDTDESAVAIETAKAMGLSHEAVSYTEKDLLRVVDGYLGAIDQPTVDGLNTYMISKAAKDAGLTVALSGLGGDELFGGYGTFNEIPRLHRLGRLTRMLPRSVRALPLRIALAGSPYAARLKAMEMAGGPGGAMDLYFRRRRLFSDGELMTFGLEPDTLRLDGRCLPPESEPDRCWNRRDLRASLSILESRFYMGNMLLRDADVFGMAHGLEIRVPLLDQALADLVYRVPGRWRCDRRGTRKPLLVDSLGGRLPAGLAGRRKQGFGLPQAAWLAGPLRDRFDAAIRAAGRAGLIDPQAVDRTWRIFLKEPEGHSWSRVWLLGVLGTWLTSASSS